MSQENRISKLDKHRASRNGRFGHVAEYHHFVGDVREDAHCHGDVVSFG